jgi:D-inositol-3-phosphate glycosyltransferase
MCVCAIIPVDVAVRRSRTSRCLLLTQVNDDAEIIMSSPSLKIGLITDNYPAFIGDKSFAGGIGTYTQLVAHELADQGHEVHVFTYAPVQSIERSEEHGVTVWACPSWTQRRQMSVTQSLEYTLRFRRRHHPMRFPLLLAVRTAARGRRFDVIESPDHGTMGAIVQMSGLTDRFAIRLHSTIKSSGRTSLVDATPEKRRLLKEYLLSADVVTAPTSYVLNSVEADLGHSFTGGRAVGNPVRVRPFRLHQPEFPDQAVFFGRMYAQKGVDILARAIPLVTKELPTFSVSFIGPDLWWKRGEKRASEMIRECAGDASSAVRFVGQLRHDQLAVELPRYAMCLLPSRWETFGMTLIEAMNWSVPVVASDIPPFMELTEEGAVGRLVRTEDPRSLADAVLALLREPISEQELRRAHEHASRWSVQQVTMELLDAWMGDPRQSQVHRHSASEALASA